MLFIETNLDKFGYATRQQKNLVSSQTIRLRVGPALLLAGMGGTGGVCCPDMGGGIFVGRTNRDWVLDRLCGGADGPADRDLRSQG